MIDNQITIYDGITNPIAAAKELGAEFAASGMFGCTKKEQGTILALYCMSTRKNPFEVKRTFHIVDGNLTMRSDAMLAEWKRRHYWKWLTSTTTEASCEIQIDGETYTEFYTWDDVVRAELHTKKNYKHNPEEMLRARLISKVIRKHDPGIVEGGAYTPEEVSGFATVEKVAMAQVIESDVEALEKLLEPFEPEVNAILRENGHIQQGENFRDLPAEAARRILSTPNHPLIEAARVRRPEVRNVE